MAWGTRSDELPQRSSGGGSTALSFIGSEVTVTGNVSGGGDLHIDGGIEGDIACNTLILGASGRVKGNIAADKATLAGTVGGTVSARTLIIEKGARITGDLAYESITIETGAEVDGRLCRRAEAARAPAAETLKLVAENE